ncbi:hypothetical protein [Methylobacterium isbiliense]|jgi:hypothetical protein|uniref:Beta-barrel assembly machine subunit BamF n=1 Tax=Methylobacterium isbiliense TaxID=315478 RepID=A0ABQ4SID7_9HYPH|nr:hypothetical protein [Methylobacterium isbiliense]MDN3626977.1 hypothetical protein [Methylobacterium isbiliense]GJE02902.1 hypothetical protein GMJLKIPL_4851 [Methylobacterium isbiliense]
MRSPTLPAPAGPDPARRGLLRLGSAQLGFARPALTGLCAACLGVVLGGCVLDGGNPVREAAKAAGIAPPPATAPDFVARSRREGGDFLPVGVSAPPRAIRAKSAAGVKDLEADLDASRQRNEARGRDAAKAGGTTQAR